MSSSGRAFGRFWFEVLGVWGWVDGRGGNGRGEWVDGWIDL